MRNNTNRRRLAMGTLAASITMLLAPATVSAQALEQEAVHRAVAAFNSKSARQRKEILAAVRAAVDAIDHPYLQSVRHYADLGRQKVKPRIKMKEREAKTSSKTDFTLLSALPFPVANKYVFGRGDVALYTRSDQRMRRGGKFPFSPPEDTQLAAMLQGHAPDSDLAVAGILRELDTDRAADTFSAFLESWRNGSESLYRALDSTAGTDEGVFFYDACLGDFVDQCVPKNSADHKALRRSNDAAHDALHRAFLSYRQYRGLREAVALSMLLPPDQQLPPALARYDGEGQYDQHSTREMFAMLLGLAQHDIGRVVAIVNTTARPLPQPLWSESYQPFPPLHAVFRDRMPEIIEAAGHTRAYLEQLTAERQQLHDQIARAAMAVLQQSGIPVEASASSGR